MKLSVRGAKMAISSRISKFEFEFVDWDRSPEDQGFQIRSEAFSVGDKPISFRDENGNFVSAADI